MSLKNNESKGRYNKEKPSYRECNIIKLFHLITHIEPNVSNLYLFQCERQTELK